jgi:hypothetical protein
MLQVNGKRFDKFDKSNPFTEVYNSCMKLLYDYKFDKVLLVSPEHKTTINQEGSKEFSGGGWAKCRQKYVGIKGEFDVVYFESSSFNPRRNNIEEFQPRNYSFNGSLASVNVAENPDLAFFLVFVSIHCELKVEFDLLQNKIKREKRKIYWKIEDKKAEAKNTIVERQMAIKIQNAIYSEDHRLDIEVVKIIARNVGLGALDALSEDQIRVLVGDYFLEQKNGLYIKKKLNEFDEINPGKTRKIDEFAVCKSVVAELKELKMVEVKKVGGRFEYRTSSGDAIVTFLPGRNADETLANLFKENPGEREMFEEKIKDFKNQK